MSQSPLSADVAPEKTLPYKQGWRALNRLLHQDRSFSGRERNCAFLNCGGRGFADNSAVSGFDFADDARAIVATDWDFDGDLDVWLTCRNAPRVRLLENRSSGSAGWLGLRLEGDGMRVNRDAVGATVEVWLEGEGNPLLRTLHGGDAFLSQNGTLLHFGLGEKKRIAKVVVHWGGGLSNEIQGVKASGFYLIKFGSSEALPWVAPKTRALVAASQTALPDEEEARIVLPARLPLPALDSLSEVRGPMIINLWSATCESCVKELKEWSEEVDTFAENGLKVHLLNTDGDPGVKGQFPFDSGVASLTTIRTLDLFQRAILDRWVNLPVPSSFLIDGNGDVAIIYKGPVLVDQLMHDVRLLTGPEDSWRAAAIPFPGPFISKLPKPDPTRVSSQLLDANQPLNALRYLEQYASRHPNEPDVMRMIAILRSGLGSNNEADQFLAKADAFRDSGDKGSAIAAYKEVLRRFPKTLEAAENLAWVLASDSDDTIRRPQEAKALAMRLCQIARNQNPDYLDLLSVSQAASGEFDGAIRSVLKALEIYGEKPAGAEARERLELYRQGKAYFR